MQKFVLRLLLLGGISSLPFLFKKPPLKDWLLIYSLTAVISGIVDTILISKKYLEYPVRLLPNFFKIHFVFDFVLCPIIMVWYAQLTYKDKLPKIILKLLPFTTIHIIIESIAEKNTHLIKWKNGWHWYHSFITMTIKYLGIRLLIHLVTIISKKQARI